MSCLRWWWSEHLTSARRRAQTGSRESEGRQFPWYRINLSPRLLYHLYMRRKCQSLSWDSGGNGRACCVQTNEIWIWYWIKRIECLVRGLKTITYDHNNLYIWSCGHWKFTTSVPQVNLLRFCLSWKLPWPWCSQSPCSECGVSVTQCYSVWLLL